MSNKEGAFIDLVMSGKALLEEVDDFVDCWHESESRLQLDEFLGMRPEEYVLWVEDESNLAYIIASRREGLSVSEFNAQHTEFKLAARAEKSSKVRSIKRWLEQRGASDVGKP